jgi:protein-S-isoprenylcysteine O-methyltransferase Ste14
MMEYRISIGKRTTGSAGQPPQPQGKLQILKATILTLLALSAIIGVFLAAFVIGSVIASILLILFGVSLLVWLIRGLFLRFARTQKNL